MLVFAREPGQKVVITHKGERLTLTITLIEGRKVRLGFEAPDSFKINRDEVQDQIDQGIEQRRFDG